MSGDDPKLSEASDSQILDAVVERGLDPEPDYSWLPADAICASLDRQGCPLPLIEALRLWLTDPSRYRMEEAMGIQHLGGAK